MIGQEISLHYLIPFALEVLTENLWAEGDFYEGDFLQKVLNVKVDFWDTNRNYWRMLNDLIKDSRSDFPDKKIDTSTFDKIQFFI